MGRSKNLFSAVMMSVAVLFGTVPVAQAQYVSRDGQVSQNRAAQKLTLPQKADILNKMAIHNARKGDLSGAARFFLKSFHASRKARDKRRAMRAIANLKRLERKFGKAAILGHKRGKLKTSPAEKPSIYNMPDWRQSREA